MRQSVIRRLARCNKGAIAPTTALSLLGLIVAGGVAFDYARLASLDTELQQAADQAALAAASQLDGKLGACSRAASAASTLITNRTLMANDAQSTTIDIANEAACDAAGTVRFWQDKAKTTAADADANANFVEVQVETRTANYTFTPIVAAFSGTSVYGQAFAGLGEAICKVPPVMFCNPLEGSDPNFTVANYVGKGMRLVANDGGGGYGPGNFGFLETGAGTGASALAAALGRTVTPGNCVPETGVTTEPGAMVSVLDALNTRFDIYANGLNQACGNDGSLCAPSTNSRKDLLKAPGSGNNACTIHNQGWQLPLDAYGRTLPISATTPLTESEAATLAPMGYPRDMCHAVSSVGVCSGGRIGDGNWDRDAYFRTNSLNYPTLPTVGERTSWFGSATPTRYAVYDWERQNAATRLQPDPHGTLTSHGTPICNPPGVPPSSSQVDRRIITAAVINCSAEGIAGRTSNVDVVKWIDLFLVEPSTSRPRTEQGDVYVEVIREALNVTGAGAVQTVRKAVPYLIE